MRWCVPDGWVEPRLPAGVTVDHVRATLRWTGDWTGAGRVRRAGQGSPASLPSRLEEAHREIGRLNTVIGERDASLATRNAELARAEEALTEARHTRPGSADAAWMARACRYRA